MSNENTGGAEMSEFNCLLPREDGYLGLGKSFVQHYYSFIGDMISINFGRRHNLLTDTLPSCTIVSKPITTHLLVSQTHGLPTPATTPGVSQSFFSSDIPPLPLPSSQRYVHPEHLLKGRFIPTGAASSGSKLKDVEMLQEVSDSETSAKERPTKKAALPTGEVDLPPPVSPAKKTIATPIATVKNLRKRKKEPVIGGDGKAPKRRKKDE